MNVLFLNATDIEGGAARAAFRLLAGMRQLGVPARMLVQRKSSDSSDVTGPVTRLGKVMGIVRPHLDQLSLLAYPRRTMTFFPSLLPSAVQDNVANLAPDIIHMHWVAGGFMRVETIGRFNRPVVWTLHDSWPFTGGCTMPLDCRRYMDHCGRCPILGSSREHDLSSRLWTRKRNAWERLDLTVIAPSRWLAESAKASSLFRDKRIEVIPNGLDLGIYRPVDKAVARELLGLPPDKKLILFGGVNIVADRNKGFHLLVQATIALAERGWGSSAELLVAGCSGPPEGTSMPLPTRYLGQLRDDISLVLLYSAADVFVLPSIQENLPNTIVEAMACGTPCVAFAQGGIPDLIDHERTGYLAQPWEPDDLAMGIAWLLEDNERRETLGQAARRKVEQDYEVGTVARRHVALYEEILNR